MGMAAPLRHFPEAMDVFERARRSLHWDVFVLCLNGPGEKLAEDTRAQIAVHVTNCAWAAVLRRMTLRPRVAAGFSLGIFSALVAAGSLSFEQGLEGVVLAAEEMSREGGKTGGAMAAVIGLSEAEIARICAGVPGAYLASVNNAKQVVISGREEAVDTALAICEARGALFAKRLPIRWAIHTPLMEAASAAFARVVENWSVRPPSFPVLSYLDGEVLADGDRIKRDLSIQFSRPNDWHKVLLRMKAQRIDTYVEVGPGNTLSRMVRWVERSARVCTVADLLADQAGDAARVM